MGHFGSGFKVQDARVERFKSLRFNGVSTFQPFNSEAFNLSTAKHSNFKQLIADS